MKPKLWFASVLLLYFASCILAMSIMIAPATTVDGALLLPTPTSTLPRKSKSTSSLYLPLILKNFDSANKPPTARITAPPSGEWITAGKSTTFTGSATDPEQGSLTGNALVWRSDRDGQIGTGTTCVATLTSTGMHTITLTATDSGGQIGIARIQVRVPAPGITGGQKPVRPVYQPSLDDPVGFAINAAETIAYVAEKGAGRLSKVDINPASPTYRAITPIASGLVDLQMGIALNAAETYAYFVENDPGTLKRVTLATGQVTTIAAGLYYPHDVAITGTQVYVTLDSGALVRVDVTNGQVFTITTNLYHPAGIVLLPGATEALVAEPGGKLQRVNLTTGTMAGWDVGFMLHSVALDPTGNKAYVGDYGGGTLRRVNAATGQVEKQQQDFNFQIGDVAIGASNTRAYVLWRPLGQIAFMDLSTWESTPVFEVLDVPTGVALNAAQTRAYVLERQNGDISRVDVNPASPGYAKPVRVANVGTWSCCGGGSVIVSRDETWALALKDSFEPTNLLRVDLTNGLTSAVTSVSFGCLRGGTLSPDERFAYLTGCDTVRRLDLSTGAVVQVGDFSAYQWGLNGSTLTADGQTLYVAQRDLHRLLRVNVNTGNVFTVTSDLHLPVAVALAPGGATAWVLEEGHGGVLTQIDLNTGLRLTDIPLQPWVASHGPYTFFVTGSTGSLAVTSDGTKAYALGPDGEPRFLYTIDLTVSSSVRVLYKPPMLEVRDLALNQAETRAYMLDKASQSVYQLDIDPTSPTSGSLSALVDGRISGGNQVALSADGATLVVVHDGGLARFRVSDGVMLNNLNVFGITSVALHPTQPIAYVTTNEGNLQSVNLNTGSSSTIASGLNDPRGIVLNSVGAIAYLAEKNAGRLVKVTLSTGAVSPITTNLDQPLDVTLDETGGVAYVLEDVLHNHRVSKVNLTTGTITWAYTGEYTGAPNGVAWAIALSKDRQHIYLARRLPGSLWRIDLAQAAVATTPPSTSPHAIGYHPEPVHEDIDRQQSGVLSADGKRLYICDEFTPRLKYLDIDSRRIRWVTGLEWSSLAMAITPNGQTLYYARMYTGGLVAVNLTSGASTVVSTNNVHGGLVLDPTNPNVAYGTDGSGEVYRMDLLTATRTVLPIQTPSHMAAATTLAINAAGTHLYIVLPMMGELGNTAIVRFDLTTNQATTIANVNAKGDWPGTIIVDQAERFAYITYLGWSGISNITWGGAARGH